MFFAIINTINIKIIKVFKFILAKFLLKFLLQYIVNTKLYKDFLKIKIVKNKIKIILIENNSNIKVFIIEKRYFKKQLAKIDIIWDLILIEE